jgi:hypothetical protein
MRDYRSDRRGRHTAIEQVFEAMSGIPRESKAPMEIALLHGMR